MELKEAVAADLQALNACFNRTFMELKAKFPPTLPWPVMFQSHLYGIERSFIDQMNVNPLVSIAPLWN